VCSSVILNAVGEARAVLARYVEVGGPSDRETLNELLRILDDEKLIAALNREHAEKLHEAAE
jgi:hypothetical protein